MGFSEDFDGVIKETGGFGRFQKKQLLLVVVPYILFYSFILNFVFIIGKPSHWCHVPGRDETNLTLEEWKQITLPVYVDMDHIEMPSKCQRYINRTQMLNVTQCTHGWEYSTDVYKETAVTQFNWVCDDKRMATYAVTLTFLAHALSSFLFGPITDYLGRKVVFLVTILIWVSFGSAALFSTSPTAFLVLWFIKNLTHQSCSVALIVLLTEFVLPEQRGLLNMLMQLTWPIGMALMTLITWLFEGHWKYAGLATTLPLIYFLFLSYYLPESPRWLAARGRVKEAEAIIFRIAKDNGKEMPKNVNEVLTKHNDEVKKIGFITLIRYAKQRTRILSVMLTSAAGSFVYTGSTLSVAFSAGNRKDSTYLRMFLLSIMDIPGQLFAVWFMDKVGRRVSTAILLMSSAIFCIIAAAIPPNVDLLVLFVIILAKATNAGIFLTVMTHQLEVFPTAFRATAMTPTSILVGLVNLIVPLVVELEAINSALPFLCFSILPLIAAPMHLLLPETANKSLPQSIEESEEFGSTQKFWSLNKNDEVSLKKEKEHTNL